MEIIFQEDVMNMAMRDNSISPDDIMAEIKERLRCIVTSKYPQCILFSGGLDSSIAAVLSTCKTGIIVTLGQGGPDLEYAMEVARIAGMDLHHRKVDIDEAMAAIPDVIKILRSFDPAIPNDLAVYFALDEARSLGPGSVMTGDGSDELFGGYSYMETIADLDRYIREISHTMGFNSTTLGSYFGIEVLQPFLDEEFLDFATRIQGKWKIREENGKVHGKWILRKAFEGILPDKVLWQGKRPLEEGSGMTRLRDVIGSMISDREFEEKKRLYPAKFYSKDHVYYYEVFRDVIGDVPPVGNGEKACTGCGAGMEKDRRHCRVCGWIEEDR